MSSVYYGGNSMSSMDEYLDLMNKMHRDPSTMIITEAPSSYPVKHKEHHRVKIFHAEDYQQQQQQQAPELHKKVHFTQNEERGKNQVCEERTIDMEADGFIQKRHKNFESCNTYKGY